MIQDVNSAHLNTKVLIKFGGKRNLSVKYAYYTRGERLIHTTGTLEYQKGGSLCLNAKKTSLGSGRGLLVNFDGSLSSENVSYNQMKWGHRSIERWWFPDEDPPEGLEL
mgnify:CR=1 FL=1